MYAMKHKESFNPLAMDVEMEYWLHSPEKLKILLNGFTLRIWLKNYIKKILIRFKLFLAAILRCEVESLQNLCSSWSVLANHCTVSLPGGFSACRRHHIYPWRLLQSAIEMNYKGPYTVRTKGVLRDVKTFTVKTAIFSQSILHNTPNSSYAYKALNDT